MLSPVAPEAERALLGCLLKDSKSYRHASYLRPEDFSSAVHASIFRAIQQVKQAKHAVNLVSVASRLGDGRLAMIGGPSYLAGLMNEVPTAVHTRHYARIIERKAVLRNLIAAAENLR